MTVFLFIYFSLLALTWLVLLLGPWHRDTFNTRLDADALFDAPIELPPLTIIVPARNEASVLPATISSMCRQDYPNLKVILVDDQSDDDSPRVIEKLLSEHENLIVVRASDRPAGWCGKPWAVQDGARHATSDLLLFTDADCVFDPRTARLAVSLLLRENFDMLSLFPRIEFGTVSEQLGMGGLVCILTTILPLSLANKQKSKVALAAGAFILVRREAYEKIDGHACVRAEIIEDLNIAKRLKESGAKVHARFSDMVSTRMYEGFADMWEGLAKNAYAGMEYRPYKFWGILISALGAVLTPIYLSAAIIFVSINSTPTSIAMFWLSLIAWLAQTLVQFRAVRSLGLPLWQSIAMPISVGLYCLIAIDSARQHHFSGGNLWKGRRYDRQMLLNNADPISDVSPK